MSLTPFIAGLPKAELHLHIEGSLEPEQMFEFARRNRVALPFASVEEIKAAYDFSNLQDFLDIYYAGADVLRTEDDFREMALAYFRRAAADSVRHAEIFFDPRPTPTAASPSRSSPTGCWRAWMRRSGSWASPRS